MQELLKRLIDKRATDWAATTTHLEEAAVRASVDGYEHAADDEIYARQTVALDASDKRIAELTSQLKGEKAAEEARAFAGDLGRKVEAPAAPEADQRSDHQIIRELRGGHEFKLGETRDMAVGTDTAGGHAVPTGFSGMLMEHIIDNAGIRQTRAGANAITTASGEDINFPKTTAHNSGAALVLEAGTLAEGDSTLGVMTLGSYRYGVLIQLSHELIRDEAVNLLEYITRDAGRAIGNASGLHMITGDGSGKPNGIAGASTLGVTAAATTSITGDELISLVHSVLAGYRKNGEWLMADATLAAIRKLKDSNAQYLWSPGLTIGQPSTLLGAPVHTDPNVPAMTTGLTSVLFGDMGRYQIRDTGSVRVERSDDFAFNKDQVTYRVILATDGDLSDVTGAVKNLTQL